MTYGLYVLSTNYNGIDNGCIINTVTQVASNPDKLAISVNKQNYTCELIEKSSRFTVSSLVRKRSAVQIRSTAPKILVRKNEDFYLFTIPSSLFLKCS